MKETRVSPFEPISAISEASKNPGNMSICVERSYHLPDEDLTEVDKKFTANGLSARSLPCCKIKNLILCHL